MATNSLASTENKNVNTAPYHKSLVIVPPVRNCPSLTPSRNMMIFSGFLPLLAAWNLRSRTLVTAFMSWMTSCKVMKVYENEGRNLLYDLPRFGRRPEFVSRLHSLQLWVRPMRQLRRCLVWIPGTPARGEIRLRPWPSLVASGQAGTTLNLGCG